MVSEREKALKRELESPICDPGLQASVGLRKPSQAVVCTKESYEDTEENFHASIDLILDHGEDGKAQSPHVRHYPAVCSDSRCPGFLTSPGPRWCASRGSCFLSKLFVGAVMACAGAGGISQSRFHRADNPQDGRARRKPGHQHFLSSLLAGWSGAEIKLVRL